MNVFRKGGRVAEGARLESVFAGNCNVGSNPTLSARYTQYCKPQFRKVSKYQTTVLLTKIQPFKGHIIVTVVIDNLLHIGLEPSL